VIKATGWTTPSTGEFFPFSSCSLPLFTGVVGDHQLKPAKPCWFCYAPIMA